MVTVGADIARILDAPLDVEIGVRGRHAIFQPARHEPPMEPFHPHEWIADDHAVFQIVLAVALILDIAPVARVVGEPGRQIPRQVLERFGARQGDDVLDALGAFRHEVVGVVPRGDAVGLAPLNVHRIAGAERIDQVDVSLGVDVVEKHVGVLVRAEVHLHLLARVEDPSLFLVDPDVDRQMAAPRGDLSRRGGGRRGEHGEHRSGGHEGRRQGESNTRGHGTLRASSGLFGSI